MKCDTVKAVTFEMPMRLISKIRHLQSKAQNSTALRLLILAVIALALAYQFRLPIVLEMSSESEEIYLARGFYQPEEAFGVTYRWTDGNAQVRLPGLGSGVPLRLQANLHEFRPPMLSPNPAILSVNDREAARFTPGTELAAYDWDLPAGLVDVRGDATIGLKSDTFVPKQAMGTTDERSLGLFIEQIKISYGPGIIIPPVITWALLALGVIPAYGFGRVVRRGTQLGVGAGLLVLACEITGVIAARTWTAYNSAWWAITILCLSLIALRLKSGQQSAVSGQLPVVNQRSLEAEIQSRVASQPRPALHPLQSAIRNLQSAVANHKSEILTILAVFIAWRIALIVVPIVGADVEAVTECCPRIDPTPVTSLWQAAFERWYRWDAIWYGSIAQGGYQYAGMREPSNVAFFPLFPLVNGVASHVTGLPVAISGPLVSTLLTLVACLLLYRVAHHETGDTETATRSVVYLLAFPTAYYMAIGYTEALYVVCVLAALLWSRQGRWGWSGVATFLAGMTRLHGVLLMVPLTYEYFRQHSFRLGNIRGDLLSLAGAPAGVLAFLGYLGLRFGQPLAYFQVNGTFFNRSMRPGAFVAFPGTTLVNYVNGVLSNPPSTEGIIETGAIILLLALTLEVWVRLPRAHGVYMLTIVLFSLTTGNLYGMPRYVVPMYPGFVALGQMGRHSWVDRTILAGFVLLQGVLALMFTNGYWVA